jgi:hypothetical protein
VVVYAVVDDSLSPTSPLGDSRDVFVRREDAERFTGGSSLVPVPKKPTEEAHTPVRGRAWFGLMLPKGSLTTLPLRSASGLTSRRPLPHRNTQERHGFTGV